MSQPTTSTQTAPALADSPVLVVVLLSGFLLALFGTYWDDAWHTEEGRDSFLIAPHIALYLGISLAGGALSAWAVIAARKGGWRTAMRRPGLLLALVGIAVTFLAAPIDNLWHVAFGRDAVIWSPPHMLGIAGTLAIGAAVLLELSSARGRAAAAAQALAGGAVLAAAAVPVLEYETDVPQFDVVFYLPVLAGGAALALSMAQRAMPGPWPASRAAVAHMLTLAVIAAVLLAAAMPAPLLPLLIVPALALDWMRRRGLSLPLSAAFFAGVLYAVYVPYLDLLKDDIFLDLEDVVFGLPLAVAASYLGLAAIEGGSAGRTPPTAPVVLGSAMALAFAAAVPLTPSASAHDPGQGSVVGLAKLSASSTEDTAALEVELLDQADCNAFEPVAITGRRAGVELAGQLERVGRCSFRGVLQLEERGRWFLYAELAREGKVYEAWLPIHVGEPEEVVEERSLYLPAQQESSVLKTVAGLTLYAGVASLLIAIGRIYRRRPGDAPV